MSPVPSIKEAFLALQLAARKCADAGGLPEMSQWTRHYGKGTSRCLGYLVAFQSLGVLRASAAGATHDTMEMGSCGKLYTVQPFNENAKRSIGDLMSVGTAWRDCVLPRLPRTALEYGECVDHLMKMMPGPAKVGYVKKWLARCLIVTAMGSGGVTLHVAQPGWPAEHLLAQSPPRLSQMFPDQCGHLLAKRRRQMTVQAVTICKLRFLICTADSSCPLSQEIMSAMGYDGKLELFSMWLCILNDSSLLKLLSRGSCKGSATVEVLAYASNGEQWSSRKLRQSVLAHEQEHGILPMPLPLLLSCPANDSK